MSAITRLAAGAAFFLSFSVASHAEVLSSFQPSFYSGSRESLTSNTSGNGGNYLVRISLGEKSVLDAFSIVTLGDLNPTVLTFKLWSNLGGQPSAELVKKSGGSTLSNGKLSFSLNSLVVEAGTYWMGLSGNTALNWAAGNSSAGGLYELRGETRFFNHSPYSTRLAYSLEGTPYSAVPVPGPEAGAGLGALAMLGVAYWAKRRRDEKALAA